MSLFADSGPDPWAAGIPVPRRGADNDIVKNLLTADNSNLPEEYVDYFDSLLAQYGTPDDMISAEGVGKILEEGGVDQNARERIWAVIMKGAKESIHRDEVNVLLAMVGLAQEGDEISIDGVDDRRRSKFNLVSLVLGAVLISMKTSQSQNSEQLLLHLKPTVRKVSGPLLLLSPRQPINPLTQSRTHHPTTNQPKSRHLLPLLPSLSLSIGNNPRR